MWILVGLLISFGFAVLCGKWCGRNDVAEDYYKTKGMPYRNSEGKVVNAVWYCKQWEGESSPFFIQVDGKFAQICWMFALIC